MELIPRTAGTEEARVLELTGALKAELQRMRQQPSGSAAPIRITRRQDGTFALEFDALRDGDVAVDGDCSGSPGIVIGRELADQLDGAILHFRGTGDDRYGDSGLVLLRQRQGTPRGEWTPVVAVAARLPVWTRVRRRLGSSSPRASATQTAGL